jgi:hypothetical protein
MADRGALPIRCAGQGFYSDITLTLAPKQLCLPAHLLFGIHFKCFQSHFVNGKAHNSLHPFTAHQAVHNLIMSLSPTCPKLYSIHRLLNLYPKLERTELLTAQPIRHSSRIVFLNELSLRPG